MPPPSSPPDDARAPVAGATSGDLVRSIDQVEAEVLAATARLEELEALQALVVSTTAHELRTPLTVLRVHADLLREAGSDLGPDERESLEAIHRAVGRLQDVSDRLVEDLRDGAGGAEAALRRWLRVDQDSTRTRPTTRETRRVPATTARTRERSEGPRGPRAR